MIKRIKKIQNIGRFKLCQPSQAQFDKITLIFGRNTYGKTTLGEILSSLASGNADGIIQRKSIPNDQQSQQVEISFVTDELQNEHVVKYSSGHWLSALPSGFKLEIFDDGFYHTNLFSGRQFSRETNDNFTSFVLGVLGVAKSQEIESKNKQKGEFTRKRNELQKAVFNEIDNLDNFLKLSPTESKMELNLRIESLRNEYGKLNKQQKNGAATQERTECVFLGWGNIISIELTKLNESLQTSLESHHQEAQHKLNKHIQASFKVTQNAENWIRQGLTQNNSEVCQFCGQFLSTEALELLKIYQTSFDTSYDDYDNSIKKELNESQSELITDRISSLKIIIEGNKAATMSYPELLEDNQKFLSTHGNVNLIITQLYEDFSVWESIIGELKNAIDSAIKQKLASPHKQVDALQFDILLEIDKKISSHIGQYNGFIIKFNYYFQQFKASVIDSTISQRLVEIYRQGIEEKRKLKRLELSDQCTDYKKFDTIIQSYKVEIPQLELELANEQSQFLDKFFDRLNRFFNLFGSHDFQLERALDTKGHKPIYFLKIKFHGHPISEKNMDRVFSESDRRSLALSVFWAVIDGLSNLEKRKCIIVLDDPVTSFDNHRISSVYSEIVKISDDVRQIILLSHFEQGVTHFLNTYKDNGHVKLLSIERTRNSSEIRVTDIENFIKSSHEKATQDIFSFIQGDQNTHNIGDLRIFLEYEIDLRFAKQLIGIDAHNLSDRIDKLKEIAAISDLTANEAHKWREILNPSHHIWVSSDIEDQRHNAREFMGFIYHRLIPI